MTALGMLMQDMFGTSNLFSGLGCVPTIPASLAVTINPGSAYALQNLDNTPYSSLPADIAHQIVKQGVMLNAQTLAIAAPLTSGFSINYLVSANFVEADANPVVLAYYNAANPSQAFSGPNGTGVAQNTTRQDTVQLTLTAGAAATSGTQSTPATPAGTTALWVITVAFGQTTITAGNITKASGAPFLTTSLLQQIQAAPAVAATPRNLLAQNTGASANATWTADEIIVKTALGSQSFVLSSFSKTINLATTGAGGMDVGAAPINGFVGIYAIYNPATGAQSILATNATAAVVPEIYGGTNMPAGYTASALLSILGTNGSRFFSPFIQNDRSVSVADTNIASVSAQIASLTQVSVSAVVPPNAKNVSGNFSIASTSASNPIVRVSSSTASIGAQTLSANNGASGGTVVSPFTKIKMFIQQGIFWAATITAGTFNSAAISINGYDF